MAGLIPAIHVFLPDSKKDADAREDGILAA